MFLLISKWKLFMKIERFVTGPIQVNTYLLFDEESKEAILIDVGGSAKSIIAKIEELGLTLKGIYNTHGHFDHILGAKDVQDMMDIPFFVHKGDVLFVENLEAQMEFYGLGRALPPQISGFIDEQTVITLGKTEIKVIETPGHTEGGVCFLVDNNLFSGDTLFLESIGRTDLPGGDYKTLKTSILEKLFVLSEEIVVYPGHDVPTSIGHEKEYNIMV